MCVSVTTYGTLQGERGGKTEMGVAIGSDINGPHRYGRYHSLAVEECCVDWIVALDGCVVACGSHLLDLRDAYIKRELSM